MRNQRSAPGLFSSSLFNIYYKYLCYAMWEYISIHSSVMVILMSDESGVVSLVIESCSLVIICDGGRNKSRLSLAVTSSEIGSLITGPVDRDRPPTSSEFSDSESSFSTCPLSGLELS